MIRPIAVVTGASSGIGTAIADALAATGHDLLVGYGRQAAAAKEIADDLATRHGVRTGTLGLDLTDPAASGEALRASVTAFGGIDVLVNNAGLNRRATVVEETLEEWQRILDTNLTSPFRLSQVAAERMIAQGRGGRIVNITSIHEHIPIGQGSTYCAAKGGLGALTKAMALDLAGHGITVNAVAPGETATPMNNVPAGVDAADIARPAIPAGRPGRPDEVAAMVAYLASDAAAYTTGTSTLVDGGMALSAAVANAAYANTVEPARPKPLTA
ncbi:SDR family oxidoreductase [Streptomyces albidoflavus]